METHYGISSEQAKELLQQLDVDKVVDKGNRRILHHWHVRRTLLRVFGPTGWGEQDLADPYQMEDKQENFGKEGTFRTLIYRARQRLIIRRPDGAVQTFFDGVGVWGKAYRLTQDSPPEWELHNDAINGARSVALARAAISLGDQGGLGIYAVDEPDFTVGYFIPHQVPHEYRSGDGEQQELSETASIE